MSPYCQGGLSRIQCHFISSLPPFLLRWLAVFSILHGISAHYTCMLAATLSSTLFDRQDQVLENNEKVKKGWGMKKGRANEREGHHSSGWRSSAQLGDKIGSRHSTNKHAGAYRNFMSRSWMSGADSTPSTRSTGCPSLNSMRVGSAWMLYRAATAGYFSVSTFTTITLSFTAGASVCSREGWGGAPETWGTTPPWHASAPRIALLELLPTPPSWHCIQRLLPG